MRWLDHGDEQQLIDGDNGETLARVFKSGCCWYASLAGSSTSSRFKLLSEAKMVAEHLANGNRQSKLSA